jgi:methylmalonyl-CoA mutase cobalamin-binding subunit
MMRHAGLGDVGMLVGGIIPEADAPRTSSLAARVPVRTVLHEIAEVLRGQETGGQRTIARTSRRSAC